MTKKVSLIVLASFLACAATLYFAFPEQRDWQLAKWQGSISDYTEFLRKYPSSAHVTEAESALRELRATQAWQALPNPPSAADLARFLKEFPAASFSQGARVQLQFLLLRSAAERYAGQNPAEAGGRTIDQLMAIAGKALVQRPASLDDYQRAVGVLVEYVALPEAESIRVISARRHTKSHGGRLG